LTQVFSSTHIPYEIPNSPTTLHFSISIPALHDDLRLGGFFTQIVKKNTEIRDDDFKIENLCFFNEYFISYSKLCNLKLLSIFFLKF